MLIDVILMLPFCIFIVWSFGYAAYTQFDMIRSGTIPSQVATVNYLAWLAIIVTLVVWSAVFTVGFF